MTWSFLTPYAPAHAATRCAGGVNFAGRTPTAAQLSRHSLRCADLRSATLRGLDFGQADLTGADMRHAVIVGSDFTQATLTDVDMAGAQLSGSTFDQATMSGVTLTGVDARHASFEQVDLHGISLAGADLRDADFGQASLASANLAHADLRNADLGQTDLAHADLAGADIAGASLTQATTTGARVAGIRGLTPVPAGAAFLTLLLALLVLRPQLTPRRAAGSTAARPAGALSWLVLILAAALAVYEIAAVTGWQPVSDDLFILPMLTPIVFLALLVARSARRPRPGIAAVLVALLGLVGFFLVTSAGLSVLGGPAFGVFPFATTPTSPAYLFGLADTPLGIALGAAAVLIAAVLGRQKAFAAPSPDLTAWQTLQNTPLQSWNTSPPAPTNGMNMRASDTTPAPGSSSTEQQI